MKYNEIMKNKLHEALNDIQRDVVNIVRAVLDSDVGVNEKVYQNTLSDSNLYNEIEAEFDEENMDIINLMIPEYGVLYVDGDGYKWARRPANPALNDSYEKQSWPPTEAIRDWAARKGIPTDNSTIYLICRSIWWWGIKARPFIDPSFENFDKEFGEWADKLFDALTSGLDEFFNE